MKNIDLSIIIVSYNTQELTVASVASIIATLKDFSFEIIVVDNASGDETVRNLKKMTHPSLVVIQNAENYGFSRANNIGVHRAKGRYLLFFKSRYGSV